MDQLRKWEKPFTRQGQDDSERLKTHCNEGHITIGKSEEKNQGSVTLGDVKVVKEIIMEESVVRDS